MEERTACKYVVARFVPDEIRDEPINVGIILHALPSKEVKHHFIESYSHLKRIWPKSDVDALRAVVNALKGQLRERIEDENYLSTMSEKFRHQLQFSDVRGVLAKDADRELTELYTRIVDMEGRRPKARTMK